jgi:hypothetical protein
LSNLSILGIEIDLTVVGPVIGFFWSRSDSQSFHARPVDRQHIRQEEKSLKAIQAAYSSRFPALPAE